MTFVSPILIAAIAVVMLLLAALLLLRWGPEKALRGRAESLGLGRGRTQVSPDARPSIRGTARDEQPLGMRLLGLLGRNPEIPRRYTMAWQVIVAIGAASGVLAAWQMQIYVGSMLGLMLGAAVALGTMRLLFLRAAANYSGLLFVQIPDAISLVLRVVRAGLPISEAIRTIALESPSPTADEFGRVVQETSIGVPLEVAVLSLYRRSGVQEYAFLSVTLGLQSQSGGNLVETLANLSDLVRRRVAMAAKVKALSAEGRASATILIIMPFVVGAVLAFMSPAYVADLFIHERSPAFLLAFVLLMTTGLLTMRWMIRRSATD
jgi:tight adherence protein B